MGKFVRLSTAGRYGGTVTINTDDISSVKDDYDGYDSHYCVSMKNGDKHFITRDDYKELIEKIE